MTRPVSVRISQDLFDVLIKHLFPGDLDEHGAVLLAGIAETKRGTRLLVREVAIAEDGVDYVPGIRGYRALKAGFVLGHIIHARDERLAYIAVHNHGGRGSVGFSGTDLASHERGYPALKDIGRGIPVGALVFAKDAVAGDIWMPDGSRTPLDVMVVVGSPIRRLTAEPVPWSIAATRFDRQARLFGDAGQEILRRARVGVIGVGGAGTLLVQYLSRLGVGELVVIDPQRVDRTNLPRLPGSRERDAQVWFSSPRWPRWLQRLGARRATLKVDLAHRVAREASAEIRIERIVGDIRDDAVAQSLVDCDYIFLAADGMGARLVFNAIVHQYLIPGVQIGAKVLVDPQTGAVRDVYSVVRPVWPDSGCLWCNGLISPSRLSDESLSEPIRREQRYIDEPDIHAPSVITLNATAASRAADDFLMAVTGLVQPDARRDYLRFQPLKRSWWQEAPRRGSTCSECGRDLNSRFARGGSRRLPTRSVSSAGPSLAQIEHLWPSAAPGVATITLGRLALKLTGLATGLAGIAMLLAAFDFRTPTPNLAYCTGLIGLALITAGGLVVARTRFDLVRALLGGLAGSLFALACAAAATAGPSTKSDTIFGLFLPPLLLGLALFVALACRSEFSERPATHLTCLPHDPGSATRV
jgi:hypothetical protein